MPFVVARLKSTGKVVVVVMCKTDACYPIPVDWSLYDDPNDLDEPIVFSDDLEVAEARCAFYNSQ
jgi:hypothetical protein